MIAVKRWEGLASRGCRARNVTAALGGMKGMAALRMLDQVVQAVSAYLPADVRTIRTQLAARNGLYVWAVPSGIPDGVDYDFWSVSATESGGEIGQRGPWLPWGFGTWIPVPKRLRIRLEAISALETIQEAVQRVTSPWPAADTTVKARVEGNDVVVWFHSPSGQPLPPPVRLSLAQWT
jgi:hypothetical protein